MNILAYLLKNDIFFRIFAVITKTTTYMRKARILFICQEIAPYLEVTATSQISRYLPQGIQERGREIRTFMPRFGNINERRNQLHEVIRLSGMNLIIDETDHPLIIKVASIQSARMQVYFIDNEEFFQRKHVFEDAKKKQFKDNDERAIFFCRGVLETVKKLGWSPDLIHCHGWMTSFIPLFIKSSYKDDPVFKNSKVVYSLYNDGFAEPFGADFHKKIKMDGIGKEDLNLYKTPDYANISIAAINKADAVIRGSEKLDEKIDAHLKNIDKPLLAYQSPDDYIDAYSDFYNELLVEDSVLVD